MATFPQAIEPQATERDPLGTALVRLRLRWLAADGLRRFGWLAPLALAPAAGLRLLRPDRAIDGPTLWASLAVAAGLSLLLAALRSPNRLALAKQVDDHCGLADILCSAVQLTGSSPVEQAVRRQAAHAVRPIAPGSVMPFRFPRPILFAIIPLALLLMPIDSYSQHSPSSDRPASEPARTPDTLLLARAAVRIRSIVQVAPDSAIGRAAQQLVSQLQNPAATTQQKYDALLAAVEPAGKLRVALNPNEDQLRAIGTALAEASLLEQAGRALEQDDPDRAIAVLEAAADAADKQPPSDAERQELAEAARQAAGDGANESDDPLKQALQRLAEKAGAFGQPLDGAPIRRLAGDLKAAADPLDQAERLHDAIEKGIQDQELAQDRGPQDARDGVGWEPTGAAAEEAKKALHRFMTDDPHGSEAGGGQGDKPPTGDPTIGPNGPTGPSDPVTIDSHATGGRADLTTVITDWDGSRSMRQYRHLLPDAAADAAATVHRADLPVQYKTLVRDYFTLLQQLLPQATGDTADDSD